MNAFLVFAFAFSARYLRAFEPKVIVTITINDRPVYLGWPREVPFDG